MEASFVAERESMLQNHKAEIDELLAKKREKEISYIKEKQEREDKFQKEIEAMFVQVCSCC